MDPDSIDQITAAIVGMGTLASVVVGLAKRFGGGRFVMARKTFAALTRLMVAADKKLG